MSYHKRQKVVPHGSDNVIWPVNSRERELACLLKKFPACYSEPFKRL